MGMGMPRDVVPRVSSVSLAKLGRMARMTEDTLGILQMAKVTLGRLGKMAKVSMAKVTLGRLGTGGITLTGKVVGARAAKLLLRAEAKRQKARAARNFGNGVLGPKAKVGLKRRTGTARVVKRGRAEKMA